MFKKLMVCILKSRAAFLALRVLNHFFPCPLPKSPYPDANYKRLSDRSTLEVRLYGAQDLKKFMKSLELHLKEKIAEEKIDTNFITLRGVVEFQKVEE